MSNKNFNFQDANFNQQYKRWTSVFIRVNLPNPYRNIVSRNDSFKENLDKMLQPTFSIDITENGMTLNNQLFEFPFLLSNLVHLFGDPSRIYEGEPNDDRGFYWNSKQVWDELGISTISDKAAATLDVVELEIQLSKKRQFDHMPKHPFSGKVTFNHKKIEELVVITNQYYPYPYKNLNFKDIVVRISLIRIKKVNEISCITIYKEKK